MIILALVKVETTAKMLRREIAINMHLGKIPEEIIDKAFGLITKLNKMKADQKVVAELDSSMVGV